MTQRIKLWDLPTRIFHWLLVTLIAAAYITGEVGGNAIVWHGRIGLALVGLLAFRLAWGVIGSTHARFSSFFPTPSKVSAYLRGQWDGIGHNPLGAFSVFGLLTLVALQLLTGLLANDDIAFQGYLAALIDKEFSDRLTGLHHLIIDGLVVMIGLHLAAIMFYAHIRKDNLVKPMITGWKEVEGKHAAPTGGGLVPFAIAAAIAMSVTYGASGQWVKEPPPAPTTTQAAPAW
jgi:cytochrome b